MDSVGSVLWTVFSWVLFLSTTGWVGYHWLRRSEEGPVRILAKLAATAVAFWFLAQEVGPALRSDGRGAIAALPVLVASGLVLAVLWRGNLIEFIAKFFAGFYDGGGKELEPTPLYSRAKAMVYRGRIKDAVAEVREQLAQFPTDFEGQMFLADLQATQLDDFPAAQLTIARLVEQPGHAPGQVAAALTTLAEWHLKFHQDTAAARAEFEKIRAKFPGTTVAQLAEQRLAALPSTEKVLESYDRREVRIEDHAIAYVMGRPAVKQRAQDSPEGAEQKLRDKLARYPGDHGTREELGWLYVDEFGRLDWAMRELEAMIAAPKQPQRDVVRWLELSADLQQRFGAEKADVRRTLLRIVERFPKTAAAERAQNRIFRIGT